VVFVVGHAKQAAQLRCSGIRAKTRPAALKAPGRGQATDDHWFAASVKHKTRCDLHCLGIVSSKRHTKLAAAPCGRGSDRNGIDGAESAYQTRPGQVFRSGSAS
jgi:hypothetical protein